MSIANYTELQAAITAWILRDNIPAERVRDFIRLSESKMNLRLRCRENTYTVTGDVGGGLAAITVPDDFLEMIRIRPTGTWVDDGVGGHTVTATEELPALTYNTPDELSRADTGGVPLAYTHYPDGNYWKIFPVSNYQITVWYYGRVQLSDAAPTSDLLTNWPDLYLAGGLFEAEMYLKVEEGKRGPWGQMFASMIETLSKQYRLAQISGSKLVTRAQYGNR